MNFLPLHIIHRYINSIIFWEQPIECLKTLRRCLTANGMTVITLQPRPKGATDETAHPCRCGLTQTVITILL